MEHADVAIMSVSHDHVAITSVSHAHTKKLRFPLGLLQVYYKGVLHTSPFKGLHPKVIITILIFLVLLLSPSHIVSQVIPFDHPPNHLPNL